MKKFLKYFITLLGGFALGIISIALVFGIFISGITSKMNTSEKAELSESTILKLTIGKEVNERGNSNPIDELISSANYETPVLGLDDIINGLKMASSDTKVKGIYLDCGSYMGGIATAEEIRNAILSFRKSGKSVVAYSGLYSELGYYIASACDKVVLNPRGILELDGISAKFIMYKGLFDKLGVDFQVFRVGKFKSAVEPFIQNEMSAANREQVTAYITSLYKFQIKNIASSRNISADSVWQIAMQSKAQLPKDAKSLGLVDDLEYETEAKNIAAKLAKMRPETANWFDFMEYSKDADPYAYSENKIAVIYAVGEIMPGKQNPNERIGSKSFISQLHQAQEDASIKAIVIRINSPGGSAFASDEMAHEIISCKKIKPVIVSFGDVSASGGYYMGCVADSIFALPNTITGSIGVFALLPNTEKLFGSTLGLNYETVELGELSAGWRPDRPLSAKEQEKMQLMVNSIYDDFISTVANGRNLTKSRVSELAEGRVYTAEDALPLGLIDGLGGIDRAITSAARKAKIKEYRVVKFPENEDWLSQILQADEVNKAKFRAMAKTTGIDLKTLQQIDQIQYLQGPQYLLPWSVKMH
jgi:protease-4